MAAKTSFSDGQMRAPISLVTGSRVRKEMPRSPMARWPTYLAKRWGRGSSSPISFFMRSITAGSMAERPSSFMPETKLPGSTLNSRKTSATTASSVGTILPMRRTRTRSIRTGGGGASGHFTGEVASTQMSSGYWWVISVGLACRPWIHGWWASTALL